MFCCSLAQDISFSSQKDDSTKIKMYDIAKKAKATVREWDHWKWTGLLSVSDSLRIKEPAFRDISAYNTWSWKRWERMIQYKNVTLENAIFEMNREKERVAEQIIWNIRNTMTCFRKRPWPGWNSKHLNKMRQSLITYFPIVHRREKKLYIFLITKDRLEFLKRARFTIHQDMDII